MKRQNNSVNYVAALAVFGLFIGGSKLAFSADEGYAPRGIHAGSFYLFPVLEIGIGYDDNVFRVPEDYAPATGAFVNEPVSDTAVGTHAQVTANSDWNRHALNGMAGVKIADYNEFKSENFTKSTLAVDGRLDIKRGISATAKAGYRNDIESRSSVDDRDVNYFFETPTVYGIEPTPYETTYVGAGYQYKPAKLGFEMDLDYRTLDYEDVKNVFEENVDNSDRDRALSDARLRVSYEVMPQRSLYLEGQVNSVDYDRPVDDNGIERSSTGYKTTAGMNFDLSNLLLGDVFAGHIEQNYDSPTQQDISSNLFGLHLQWFPSRLTSVNLGLDKSIEESTEKSASGYISTKARIGINHELKRNILLNAVADYTDNQFQQNQPDQKEWEDITGFDLKGTYLISRLLYTSLTYRHEYRNSDIKIQEYTDNRILLKLGANW